MYHPCGKEVSRMRVADNQRERRFDALFEAYLADMVAYCGWRALTAADAQDAVSEVFLAAWRRLDDVPHGEEARLWLYGTARRVMANQARAGRRQALLRLRLSSFAAPSTDAGVSFIDGDGGRGDTAPAAVEAVRGALAALKPVDREVLLLAEWEGLTPAQIAKVLCCPGVTARGRLFRARRRFRALLEETGLEPQPCGAAILGRLSAAAVPECGVGSPGTAVPRRESLSRGVVK
jgi:RNA polymerase sigma factor (sigma-70 family)